MTQELLFFFASVSFWVGLVLSFRTIFLLIRLFMKVPGLDAQGTRTGAWLAGGATTLLLLFSRSAGANMGRSVEGTGIEIPVTWFYTQFPGWLFLISLFFLVATGFRIATALNSQERIASGKVAAGWLAALLFGAWAYHQYNGSVTIFRGAFFLQPSTFLLICLFLLAAVALMATAARRSESRRSMKTFSTHIVLLVGCVVFGLPFAWLLLSSFKEDRDFAGGLVWIPKISQTIPYFDPELRQFEASMNGQKVVAAYISESPDGKLKLDILRPLGLRGQTLIIPKTEAKEIPREAPLVTAEVDGQKIEGFVKKENEDGTQLVSVLKPETMKGKEYSLSKDQAPQVRTPGLRWSNYGDALEYLPPETNYGLVYLQNTLLLVFFTLIGTVLSCAVVAYGFSRLRFPGRDFLFIVLLASMMLPGAVTLLPQFLIFKQLGWIDSLLPLWVPSFFAGAFNVFMLRQFFSQIPMELEDAAKIDGCSYPKTFWSVMMPQIRPALAVVTIWTFMGAWNNFMGPLIYVNSPEKMPIAYAMQLFSGERSGEPGLLMAFATMGMLPVLLLFFFAQKYFIEGVTLSGLGGR